MRVVRQAKFALPCRVELRPISLSMGYMSIFTNMLCLRIRDRLNGVCRWLRAKATASDKGLPCADGAQGTSQRNRPAAATVIRPQMPIPGRRTSSRASSFSGRRSRVPRRTSSRRLAILRVP
jgi:hypothetical protein